MTSISQDEGRQKRSLLTASHLCLNSMSWRANDLQVASVTNSVIGRASIRGFGISLIHRLLSRQCLHWQVGRSWCPETDVTFAIYDINVSLWRLLLSPKQMKSYLVSWEVKALWLRWHIRVLSHPSHTPAWLSSENQWKAIWSLGVWFCIVLGRPQPSEQVASSACVIHGFSRSCVPLRLPS